MLLKTAWIGHLIRIELTRVRLLVYLANHYTTRGALFTDDSGNLLSILLDVAQDRMNLAPN